MGDTSKLKHISIRWMFLVVRLFLAEGEVPLLQTHGCRTKFAGLALVTVSLVFSAILAATTLPTLKTIIVF